MSMAGDPVPSSNIPFWRDPRQGPLPLLLLILTMMTGLVDAVSYLSLHHVFVANMTGNIVFLGFGIAGAQEFSIPASIVAVAAFLGGSLAGGRLGGRFGDHRGKLLVTSAYIKLILFVAALAIALSTHDSPAGDINYPLVVLLALAMGIQNAVARKLAVPDLTTTVLTLTLTGLAADSTLAGGKGPSPGRRVIATLTMFVGAAIGALLIFMVGIAAVLALAVAIEVGIGLSGRWLSSSTAAWTRAA